MPVRSSFFAAFTSFPIPSTTNFSVWINPLTVLAARLVSSWSLFPSRRRNPMVRVCWIVRRGSSRWSCRSCRSRRSRRSRSITGTPIWTPIGAIRPGIVSSSIWAATIWRARPTGWGRRRGRRWENDRKNANNVSNDFIKNTATIWINKFVRIVVGVPVPIEAAPVVIGKHRIDGQEPSQHRIIIALLRIRQPRRRIRHMAGVARPLHVLVVARLAVRRVVLDPGGGAGRIGLRVRAVQGVGVLVGRRSGARAQRRHALGDQ